VLLEVCSTIELLDAFQELRWRQLVAPGFSQGGPAYTACESVWPVGAMLGEIPVTTET
jgi:hypothetical protein